MEFPTSYLESSHMTNLGISATSAVDWSVKAMWFIYVSITSRGKGLPGKNGCTFLETDALKQNPAKENGNFAFILYLMLLYGTYACYLYT